MNYYEMQTMKKQGFMYVALLFIGAVIGYNYYQGRGFLTILPFTALTTIVLCFSYLCRLDTEISSAGIKYRFKPFHSNNQAIEWKDITEIYVRRYHPFWEYRGWGVSWGKAGWACSTQGNIGIQLMLKNGKKILLGTQKPNELKDYLAKLRETYAIPLVSVSEKES